MKISDEAVAAFSEAYLLEVLSRVGTASLPSHAAVRAGMHAALPYLMPDQEALAGLAAEWRQAADEDERYLNRAHASEIHDVYASIRINREHAAALLELLGSEVPSDQPS